MQVKPLKINTIRRPGEGAPRHVFKGVLPTRQAQPNLPRSETGKNPSKNRFSQQPSTGGSLSNRFHTMRSSGTQTSVNDRANIPAPLGIQDGLTTGLDGVHKILD